MKEIDEDKRKKLATDRGLSKFLYFSGMGFQMVAVIGLFVFIGYKIDESKNSDKPIFTAVFGLLGVGISLYSAIKSIIKNKDS